MENKVDAAQRPAAPKIERIRFLKVPIDIVEPGDLPLLIFNMANEKKEQSIVLLSLWDLLRARRNGEYRNYVENASLVIPISKSIVGGARFLLKKRPVRYMPFDFVIKCLSVLEEHELSCYLLGGKKKIMQKIEKNITSTFPGLHIVGRFSGVLKGQGEKLVISAIHKSSPNLLLVGKGVRGKEMWISRNSAHLGSGLRLWCSDLFEVLAGRKWKPSKRVFELGLEWVGYCFRKPLRLFRVFPLLRYYLLVLFHKMTDDE